MLWSMLYPRRRQRLLPTVSGILLTLLATGVGVAAYNASNNILFITLALLLSCMILSGVLSWLNFRGVAWRLTGSGPWRVGTSAVVTVELRNAKRLLPTYALLVQLRSRGQHELHSLLLSARLDPAAALGVSWSFRPERRGREVIQLAQVSSLFPFGFLRKVLAAETQLEAIVWPATIDYQRHTPLAPARHIGGESIARVGQGADLLALRRYASGDSHRHIHWKASARLGRLMVRQFAAESQESYSLWLNTSSDLWPRPEQFEVLCRFAVTLAEDLYKLGRLHSVALDESAVRPVRRLRDLEEFFDRVALAEPAASVSNRRAPAGRRTTTPLLTFLPEGHRQVCAYVDGHKAATA